MSRDRTKRERLDRLIPDPHNTTAGLVPVVTQVDPRTWVYTLQAVAPGSAQTKIQFEYNTAALGTAGTVTTFDVESAWANFARASNTVTLTIPTPSGGTTGLTFTAATGSLSLGGTLNIANGGTGQTTANAALNALLPSQTGNATKVLTTDGTNTSWAAGGGSSPLTTKGDIYGHSTVDARIPVGSDGQSLIADSSQALGVKYSDRTRAPGCVFTNSGLLLTGTLASEVFIPYAGTLTEWEILGDASGSASIVVSNATYANYDTMTTLLTATCSSAKKAQATGLSVAVVAGALRFSGSGFSGFTRCSIVLTIKQAA